jgi:lipopolysaccharide transport system ATP-binding protein
MLSIRNLGKAYRRYRHQRDRLIEMVTPWTQRRHELLWVLRNITFDVRPGECVGIIGQNGAGKSTLLKLVTGTTQPTEGEVRHDGRIAAILELGMGFHPEFTGRQNAMMAGQLMGLDGDAMAEVLPGIASFAEIGPYLDQPVRTYSSGMTMRLAFSVATARRPDVLIIDEALSVGDAYFQHKSFARIRQFRDLGTTLLFVSHDPGAVKTLCDRALLLEGGNLVRDGRPDDILDYYNAIIAKREADYRILEAETATGKTVRQTRSGDHAATIASVDMRDASGARARAFVSNTAVELCVDIEARSDIAELTVGFLIRDRLGNDVFGTNTHHLETPTPSLAAGSTRQCRFVIPRLALGTGSYTVTVALHEGDSHIVRNYDWWDHVLAFQVLPASEPHRIGVANLPVSALFEACEPSTTP